MDWTYNDGEQITPGVSVSITTIKSEKEAVSRLQFSPLTSGDGAHYTCRTTFHSQDLASPAVAIVTRDIVVQSEFYSLLENVLEYL